MPSLSSAQPSPVHFSFKHHDEAGTSTGSHRPPRSSDSKGSVNVLSPMHLLSTDWVSGPEMTSSRVWYAELCSFAHQHYGSHECDQGKFNMECSRTIPSGAIRDSVTEEVPFELASRERGKSMSGWRNTLSKGSVGQRNMGIYSVSS